MGSPRFEVHCETRYWDASGCMPHISVLSPGDSSPAWEVTVWESEFANHAVYVRMFDDAFAAYTEFPAFFAALARHGAGITLHEVINILRTLGAGDTTERKEPAGRHRQ